MDVWFIAKDGSFLWPTTNQATVGAQFSIAVVIVVIVDMVVGLAAADFAAGNAMGLDNKEDGDSGLCLSRCCWLRTISVQFLTVTMRALLLENCYVHCCHLQLFHPDASGGNGQDTDPVTDAKNASYHPFTVLAKIVFICII